MTCLIAINMELQVYRPIPLLAWSGSFVSAIARSIIKTAKDIEIVSVSPLMDEGGRLLTGGMIKNGRKSTQTLEIGTNLHAKIVYKLKTSSNMEWLTNVFNDMVARFDSYGLKVKAMNVSFIDKEFIDKIQINIPSATRYIVNVMFYPTIFVFRGWRVLYPSPPRLIHSLTRSTTELFALNSKFMKKLARRLCRYTELIRNETRVIELDIGSNRVVKAFWGKATYGVYGYDRMKLFGTLLRLGQIINAGKSRGIGFGYVKILNVKVIE